jgi:membrane-bound lytic murein transglycosylase D
MKSVRPHAPWSSFVTVVAALLACACPAPAADDPFAPPAGFEPDIRFWMRVYTEVDTNAGLLHDEYHLGVVYEVMRFPQGLDRDTRSRRIKDAKERYAAILNRLASGADAGNAEAARVRALWPEKTSAQTLRQAAGQIRFQLGQADRFREGLIRSGAYEAHIAETLANMGVPAEIAALPHVESSFNPSAYSHAGAAGLWQFIRSTGRRYMRIDTDVDERLDPYHSTVAAAQFLKFNYELLGSWPLALSAYHHGPAGIRRAREQVGTDDIVAIARKYRSRTFGFASRNYYICFLAALQIDRDPERYFGPLQRHAEVKTRSVPLSAYVPVAVLERTFAVDRQTLRMLNPALTAAVWRGERYAPRGFHLRLPEGFAEDPVARLASLGPDERFDRQRPQLTHRAQRGETLSAIALRNGTTVSALLAANDMRDPRRLRAGQLVKIPQPVDARTVLAQADTEKADTGTAARDEAEARGRAEALARAQAAAEARAEAQKKVAASRTDPVEAAAQPPVSVESVTETEQAIARAEEAEPVVQSEGEEAGPQSGEQSPLLADPSDYSVAGDLTVEVQAVETLGHLAEWLDLRASRLRTLNGMRYGEPLVIGRRLRVEFAQVSVDEFERRRRAYHQGLQEAFFTANRIAGTEVHIVRRGESLWSIAQSNPRVPIWLLRQHNPDIDFADVRPRARIVLPQVEAVTAPVAEEPL